MLYRHCAMNSAVWSEPKPSINRTTEYMTRQLSPLSSTLPSLCSVPCGRRFCLQKSRSNNINVLWYIYCKNCGSKVSSYCAYPDNAIPTLFRWLFCQFNNTVQTLTTVVIVSHAYNILRRFRSNLQNSWSFCIGTQTAPRVCIPRYKTPTHFVITRLRFQKRNSSSIVNQGEI